MELRRLAEMLEEAEELRERADEQSEALRAAGNTVAAWVHDVRRDCCRLEAERLHARFAAEAAELWPLLLSYAEAWAGGGRRAA